MNAGVLEGYFEDFVVGAVYRHGRGKTIGPLENVGITNMVLNTAQGHFNEDLMSRSSFGKILVFGGVTIAMTIGLTMQDTGAHALRELGLDKVRLRAPVFHGDTIYSYTEVLESAPSEQPDAGVVVFRHVGVNQHVAMVCEAQRKVLVRRRPGGNGSVFEA